MHFTIFLVWPGSTGLLLLMSELPWEGLQLHHKLQSELCRPTRHCRSLPANETLAHKFLTIRNRMRHSALVWNQQTRKLISATRKSWISYVMLSHSQSQSTFIELSDLGVYRYNAMEIWNRMTASILKQDPNTKRFKWMLIYFNSKITLILVYCVSMLNKHLFDFFNLFVFGSYNAIDFDGDR